MSNLDPMTALVTPIAQLVSTRALWLAAALIALLAFKILLLPGLRGRLGERRVAAVLDRLGAETLHDVILPDERGGLTQVDHLVLTGAGLLVVETKNYRGSIVGLEWEQQWTQRLGRHSFPFQNPLRQNYLHTQAVQALAPGVPVFGRVVFTDEARFPHGLPEGVSSLRDLNADLRDLLGDPLPPPSPTLVAAWEQVKGNADRSPAARRAHLHAVRERRGAAPRRPLAWGLLGLVSVALVGLGWWSAPRPPVPTTRARPPAAVPVPVPVPVPGAAPPATALPSPAAPPSVPAPKARVPATLEWSRSDPRSREVVREDCNAAIAALLRDNTEENRKARDRRCGQGQAGAARSR